MKVFIKRVNSAIGRDGLDDGVCVFEKVINHRITLKYYIEEESDGEIVFPLVTRRQLSNLHSAMHFVASEGKLRIVVTLKLSRISRTNYLAPKLN